MHASLRHCCAGPAYDRQPFDGTWYKDFASPGWRIFEFLNMCEAANIHPVVTVNNHETPEDMADFVECARLRDVTQLSQ